MKKLIAITVALVVLFGGLVFMLNKAEAATAPAQCKTFFRYKITLTTSNKLVYDYLKKCGYNVVFNSEQPTPAPTPVPQPQPEQPAPTPVKGLTVDEQKMLDLVNQERMKAGLKPYELDMNLVKSARVKSKDMITNNYFAHNSPNGTTPWDLMKAQGVTYTRAGENLAGASNVDTAHINLMNSPGHKANILNADFTHFGIGIVDGGKYGKMFTQHFIK